MKQRRSSAEVSRLVEEYHASGQSHRVFAESKGVPVSTVSSWLRRSSKQRATPDSDNSLVPVISKQHVARDSVIRIDLPCGRRVEVLGEVSCRVLADVLSVLDPRAC